MGISYEEVISQIKDRLDIVEVVSRKVVFKKSGAKISKSFGKYLSTWEKF